MSVAPLSSYSGVDALERNAPAPSVSFHDALAEIQTAQLTLQAFASLAMERLDDLAGELRARQRREHATTPRVEESMLREPIEQLSAVAAELAALVHEQRQLASNTSNTEGQGAASLPETLRQEISS